MGMLFESFKRSPVIKDIKEAPAGKESGEVDFSQARTFGSLFKIIQKANLDGLKRNEQYRSENIIRLIQLYRRGIAPSFFELNPILNDEKLSRDLMATVKRLSKESPFEMGDHVIITDVVKKKQYRGDLFTWEVGMVLSGPDGFPEKSKVTAFNKSLGEQGSVSYLIQCGGALGAYNYKLELDSEVL